MKLNQELLKRLRTDDDLVYAIGKGVKKQFTTVRKWIEGKDPLDMLTSQAVILIIQKETGLGEEEILEQETTSAPAA